MRAIRWILPALIALMACPSEASAWGYVTHRIVADNAAAALPADLAGFYKANAAALSDASIEPDSVLKDRDGDKEKRRHYIDLDELSHPPFKDLPFDHDEAIERYGEQRVKEAGVLPWRILDVLDELRAAFRKGDWQRAVSRSGWLSHYVADAYQPLHTTRNFDGQQTCNQGVHAVIDTDLIDRLKARYRLETALGASFAPEVIREPRNFVFSEIIGNYALVDEILRSDTEAVALVKKQRKDYYHEMERQVGALARRQMTRAAAATASFWYTAWVRAGRPALPATAVPRAPREGRP